MNIAKIYDSVRLIGIPIDDPNAYVKINHIYEDDRIWIANLNMPYMGSISEIISKEEFERRTGMTF